jgi:hypothetical protein
MLEQEGGARMKIVAMLSSAYIVLALFSLNNAAAQHVYKCQNAAGKIEFSDAPCQADRRGERVQLRENSLDSSGSREYMLRKENEQLKEQLKNQQHAVPPYGGMAPQRTQPDLQAERIDALACEKAKRDYEVTASSSANSRAIVEAKRSMMYGACGMREPDRSTITIENRINNTIR